MNSFVKDPDETLDYKWDWSDWLGTDTISTSVMVVPTGITEVSNTNDATTATIFVSGGTALACYEITNRITTAGARTADRTIEILVRSR